MLEEEIVQILGLLPHWLWGLALFWFLLKSN